MEYIQHPDYTPQLAMKIYANLCDGDTLHSAGKELKVSFSLLKKWRHDYPEFDRMVVEGLEHARGWSDRIVKNNLENPKFNTFAYQCYRRIQGNDVDECRVNLTNLAITDDFAEKCKIVREAVAQGRIGPKTGMDLMNIILTESKIIETEDLKGRIEALEKQYGI